MNKRRSVGFGDEFMNYLVFDICEWMNKFDPNF